MNRFIAVLVVAAAVASAGCATRQEAPPAWVNGDAAGYPAAEYLIGRGEAGSAADARDRARADLAKVFEVRISEESVDRSSHSAASGQAARSQQEIVRELAVRIDRLVQGVEIAEQWREPASGRHHALAVLPRQRAAHALREEIGSLDQATEAYLGQARFHNDTFARLRAAGNAVAAQRQRAELQRTLRVLDISGQGVAPRWSLARLEGDYAELMMRVSVRPESSGAHARELREMLAGALADTGFTVTAAAEYTVFARLDIEELRPRDGWHWRSGVLELALRDANGQSIGTQRWMLREAATEPALAEQRVLQRAAELLRSELGPMLVSFSE